MFIERRRSTHSCTRLGPRGTLRRFPAAVTANPHDSQVARQRDRRRRRKFRVLSPCRAAAPRCSVHSLPMPSQRSLVNRSTSRPPAEAVAGLPHTLAANAQPCKAPSIVHAKVSMSQFASRPKRLAGSRHPTHARYACPGGASPVESRYTFAESIPAACWPSGAASAHSDDHGRRRGTAVPVLTL